MSEEEIEALFLEAIKNAPKEIQALMKKNAGIVNMLMGQVLRDNKTYEPALVREIILKLLND